MIALAFILGVLGFACGFLIGFTKGAHIPREEVEALEDTVPRVLRPKRPFAIIPSAREQEEIKQAEAEELPPPSEWIRKHPPK